jgi:REP element-mobilizing transposase RayT
MPKTLGYHFVKSGYGLWLPGDDRGYWSERWDEEIGFTEPHMLHPGDPVRLRMSQERMKHPPVRLNEAMQNAVLGAIEECVGASPWCITAFAIEETHFHMLITYSGKDIHSTAKWLAQQMTKAVHRETNHQGPVWCEGKWCGYLFEQSYWDKTREYIERHNLRKDLPPRPFRFITA